MTTASGRCKAPVGGVGGVGDQGEGIEENIVAPTTAASSRLTRLRSSGVSSTSVRNEAIRARHCARTSSTRGSPSALAAMVSRSLEAFSKKRLRRGAEATSS